MQPIKLILPGLDSTWTIFKAASLDPVLINCEFVIWPLIKFVRISAEVDFDLSE